MKTFAAINYRQWQRRNTEKFNSLSKQQKQEARCKGYYNKGWERVKQSWQIINQIANNVVDLFSYQLNKGNLSSAIASSIMELDKVKEVAQSALKKLSQKQQELDIIATKSLAKYPLL